jgi:hypothetical protein
MKRWIFYPPKGDAEALKDLFLTSDWPIEINHRLIELVNAWDIVTIVRIHRKVAASWWPEATLIASPASIFSRLLYQVTAFGFRAVNRVKFSADSA